MLPHHLVKDQSAGHGSIQCGPRVRCKRRGVCDRMASRETASAEHPAAAGAAAGCKALLPDRAYCGAWRRSRAVCVRLGMTTPRRPCGIVTLLPPLRNLQIFASKALRLVPLPVPCTAIRVEESASVDVVSARPVEVVVKPEQRPCHAGPSSPRCNPCGRWMVLGLLKLTTRPMGLSLSSMPSDCGSEMARGPLAAAVN